MWKKRTRSKKRKLPQYVRFLLSFHVKNLTVKTDAKLLMRGLDAASTVIVEGPLPHPSLCTCIWYYSRYVIVACMSTTWKG